MSEQEFLMLAKWPPNDKRRIFDALFRFLESHNFIEVARVVDSLRHELKVDPLPRPMTKKKK